MQLGRWGSRSHIAWIARSIAWLLALGALAWVSSTWFWQLFSPAPAPRPEVATMADYQAMANAVATRRLFGGNADSGAEGGEPAAAAFRLQGAMTGSVWGRGFAILSEGDKASIPAMEGETIRPGVTLLEVLPGKVKLKINERTEILEMKEAADMQGSEERAGKSEPITTKAGS